MVGRRKEGLGLTLGRTMFIHDERVSSSLTCVETQIAYGGNNRLRPLQEREKHY